MESIFLNKIYYLLSLLVILSACTSSSNDLTEQEIRIQYLIDNTEEVSIDPNNKNFDDLQGLGVAIGNAKVVTLGEATHGEGNVFGAKARIVEYLIQEKGFEVIAFESPLYDLHKANQNIKEGDNPVENINKSVFTIWTSSSEFQFMIDLINDLTTEGAVEIAGVDSDFFTLASESLVQDLKTVLAGSDIDMSSPDWDLFETLLQELVTEKWRENIMDEPDKNTFDRVLSEVQTLIDSNELFWQQMILSIENEAERRWIAKNGGPVNATGGLRDIQMGKNLIWLADEFYPDKKIIVWAANVHNAKDMRGVTAPEDPDFSFEDFETMGKVAAEALGNDLYVISFTGLTGQWGRWFDSESTSVATSSDGSIEAILGETGRSQTFLDLRNIGPEGAWLRERLLAKPFGYLELEANWNEVTDAFFFVRSITPASQFD